MLATNATPQAANVVPLGFTQRQHFALKWEKWAQFELEQMSEDSEKLALAV